MDLSGHRVHQAGAGSEGRRDFAGRVTPFLAGPSEARNNLPLAVLDAVAQGRYDDVEASLLWAEDQGGQVRAVLLRTPPHNAIVPHGCDPAAMQALLEHLRVDGHELPGMVGCRPEVDEAAAWWCERSGQIAQVHLRLGVYRLGEVIPKQRTPGRLRVATADDRELLLPWLEAFQREAERSNAPTPEDVWDSFNRGGLRRLELWLDESGQVVSLSGISGRTPNGIRIGPVYTPPERRRKGYAEALVAAQCTAELAKGKRFCFLFTDLDFPTSNHVYQQVGFEQIAEAAEIHFSAA